MAERRSAGPCACCGAEADTVVTGCCDDPLPATLYLTFSNISNSSDAAACPCLEDVTIRVDWDAGVHRWQNTGGGTVTGCAGDAFNHTLVVQVTCSGFPVGLDILTLCPTNDLGGTAGSESFTPVPICTRPIDTTIVGVTIMGHAIGHPDCCGYEFGVTSADVRVTEAPP